MAKPRFTLLVFGADDWNDERSVRREIVSLAPEHLLIRGNGRGASAAAYRAAMQLRMSAEFLPENDGRTRLRQREADRVLVFGALWQRLTRPELRPRLTRAGAQLRWPLDHGVPVRWLRAPDDETMDITAMPAPTEGS